MANDGFEIELGRTISREVTQKRSPLRDRSLRALPYGEPELENVQVFVAEKVMRAIESLAVRDQDREVGGVLLGGFYQSGKRSFVEITGFIEAKETDATQVSVTFTHETWQQIMSEHAQRGDGTRIVGWYHSHPGLGVFLSDEDTFVHSSFFSNSWQVALVVDPIKRDWGCFQWKEDSLPRTEGFYVYGERKDTKRLRNYVNRANADSEIAAGMETTAAGRRPGIEKLLPLWLAIVVLLALQIMLGYAHLKTKARLAELFDHSSIALERLKVSDLSGADYHLRRELIERPEDENVGKLLALVDTILSDPRMADFDNDHLDRVNLRVAAADKLADKDWKPKGESSFKGLGENKSDTAEKAETDPVKRALKIYQLAAVQTTREDRVGRAKLIKSIALDNGGTEDDPGIWYNAAAKKLEQERLQEITYERYEHPENWKTVKDTLTDAELEVVDKMWGELRK